METLLDPGQYARRLFFLNAGCEHYVPGYVHRGCVERMRNAQVGMCPGVKLVLYAFDRAHDDSGAPDHEASGFYVPDAYARDVARAHPERFECVASIHPYRKDALEALARAKLDGARGVKWLPPAMGIDPASPRCDRFYESLSEKSLPLIAH